MHSTPLTHRARWRTGFLLCILIALCGCNQTGSDNSVPAGPKTKAAETWKYWEAMNKAAVAGIGAETLADAKGTDLKPEDLANIMRDIAAGEQERCVAITSLPVLFVDSNLTAYAIQFAKARAEAAAMLTDYANALDQQRQVTSGSTLAMAFILGLLNHRNENEGVVWNALIDTVAQTGNELQQTKPVVQQIERRATGIRDSNIRLRTEELRVRTSLAQRFEREFPPVETYMTAKPFVKESPLTEKRLMQDLIGKELNQNEWTSFDSLDEFVSFKIQDTKKRDDGMVDYEVKTHLKGIRSGREWDFRLRLTYRKNITRWQFVGVKAIQ